MLSFYRQHLRAHLLSEQLPPTVDQEILTSKIICIKNFVLLKFTWFHSICEIFITVDNCNMEERLESSLRFVYYQASGDPRIAGCSCWLDIYLRECGLTCGSLFTDHHHVILFFTLYFHSWFWPRNYFNSEIFPVIHCNNARANQFPLLWWPKWSFLGLCTL